MLYNLFKTSYSHKIFFKIPSNFWIKLLERRRTILLYSLNYIQLRSIIKKLRNYYPLSLYKIRGFYEPTEIIKQKKGNLNWVRVVIIKFYYNLIYSSNIKKNKLNKLNSFLIKIGF